MNWYLIEIEEKDTSDLSDDEIDPNRKTVFDVYEKTPSRDVQGRFNTYHRKRFDNIEDAKIFLRSMRLQEGIIIDDE